MTITLQQWDHSVGYHLRAIEAASGMILSHATQLQFRPDFEAKCEEGMAYAEEVLEHVLAQVRHARAVYEGKPVAG